MIRPDFKNADEVLEYIARRIEDDSILDILGIAARRKRAREDAQLRCKSRQELRAEIASEIRALKDRPDLDAKSVLRDISELPPDAEHAYVLSDAWPLAWKGWLDIHCEIRCNSNCIPPETKYRITLTDKGREILAALGNEERGAGDSTPQKEQRGSH